MLWKKLEQALGTTAVFFCTWPTKLDHTRMMTMDRVVNIRLNISQEPDSSVDQKTQGFERRDSKHLGLILSTRSSKKGICGSYSRSHWTLSG